MFAVESYSKNPKSRSIELCTCERAPFQSKLYLIAATSPATSRASSLVATRKKRPSKGQNKRRKSYLSSAPPTSELTSPEDVSVIPIDDGLSRQWGLSTVAKIGCVALMFPVIAFLIMYLTSSKKESTGESELRETTNITEIGDVLRVESFETTIGAWV